MKSETNHQSQALSQIREASRKKIRDIKTVLGYDVKHHNTTLLECIHLVHNSLPELNFSEVKTSLKFLNHDFQAPLFVDSMTGGSSLSERVNSTIAEVVEEHGLGMGLGSQKVAIKFPTLKESFTIARRKAPNAFIAANLGGAQFVKGFGATEILRAIKMLEANALIIHLNPVQELIQVGGEPQYKGVLQKIREFVKESSIPVIVKEVGFGIAPKVARCLEQANVSAINVAGTGGTSWAAVEAQKAKQLQNDEKYNLGLSFWDWGIPTAVSLIAARRVIKIPIIASGGIRSGVDIAKSIAVGADMTALAGAVLESASKGRGPLGLFVQSLISELKTVMFAVGASEIDSLKTSDYVIVGELKEWLTEIKT